MPVPDPFSLADRFTDESSKDAGSSSSDDGEDGVEVVAAVVRANAPTEGITFNGSIHYQQDLNPSLGRGRGLLWKRPTIVPRQPSPVEIIYEKDRRKRSPVRKSSSPAKATTSSNQSGGDGSDSDESNPETMRPPSTQPKPIPKTMSTSTTSAPGKRPAPGQDQEFKRPHPFASKSMLGPARKTASSSASTRAPEGGLKEGESSKPIVGSIFKPPNQPNSQSIYPQSQPQPHKTSYSSSSQPSLRTTSQTASSQIQGQRPSAPQQPLSSSVFRPPDQPPRQPAHGHRETRIPPPNVWVTAITTNTVTVITVTIIRSQNTSVTAIRAGYPTTVGVHDITTTTPVTTTATTANDIESKLEAFVAMVGQDHARYVEYLLDEAEQMAPEPKHLSNFDAFADMPALSAPATTSDTTSVSDSGAETMAFKLKLHHGDNGKPRAPTKAFKCPVVKIKTDKEVVPKYRFHHTEIKKNILVPNTMLTFVPHLRDVDPDSPAERAYINWLNELDKLDNDSGFKTENRQQKQNKRIRDEYTATLSMYIEPWLKQLGLSVICTRSTLIRHMLSQEENKAHITQQQKDAFLNTYKDDADLSPKAMEAARMFTLAFNNVFGNKTEPERSITLRDVLLLEKRETVDDEKRAKETPPPANPERDQSDSNGLLPKVEASLSSYAVLGCNICFSHDCEHGDIDRYNYHRTFSLDSVGGVIRALKRKWADQVASMGGDDEAAAAVSKIAIHLPCHNACYRHYDVGPAAAPVTPWADSEVSVLEDMFVSVGHSQTLKAQCVVASILGRKCWEVYRKIKELHLSLPHVSPPRPKTGPKGGPPARVKPLPWYDRRKKCLMGDWQDQTSTHEHSQREITEPCHHDGPCTKGNPACPCANASPHPVLCDRFCQCTVEECALKFTGCACHSTGKTCIQRQKEGKPCICIMLNRECDPVVCKGCGAKERADPDNAHDEALHSTGCQNVSLQRGVSKTVLLGKSQLEGCGYGLFTAEDISQDEYVIEYTGELITHDEGVRREARRGEGFGSQGTSSYLFTLLEHEGIWVDAAMYGNLSRYINHASESDKKACNITPKIIYVNNEYRIKFTALRNIKAGEELFFNYGDNFPNLTKKLLQDQDGDGDNGTAASKTKGKRGGSRPTSTSNLATQGTARKATTKASTTEKGKGKGKGKARGARKIQPSDDDEDETWVKDPIPLYEEEEEDDEDEDSYYPGGRMRRRRRQGGKRQGAGRKKKKGSNPEEEDQGFGGEEGEEGEADVPMADAPTRTRRARAVSEISDSQAECDEDEDEDEDKSEDSDAPLSPSRVTSRRRRQLRTSNNTTTTSASAGPNATTSKVTDNASRSRATRSASASAYTTATSTSTFTPAPSNLGDGDGEEGEDDDEAAEEEGTQEHEEGQGRKRSNRGGARPGAGRKKRKMLRQQGQGNSGSASGSGSGSASELTTAGNHWDRLKAGIGGGSGSASASVSASATNPRSQPSNSPSAPAGPSGSSRLSPSRGKKRKAGEADVYSMDEDSSASRSEAEQSEADESESNQASSKRQKTSTAVSWSEATRNTLTRSSRATATAATKATLTISPSTMKIKPLGVTVTSSSRSPGGGTAHALRAHQHTTTQQHNAAAQAQLRAEQSLRAAAAKARQGYQVQQQQQPQEPPQSSSLYHTAANFQPFTSDIDDDDYGGEEDVASVASAISKEDDEGEEGEDEEDSNGGDVDVEAENEDGGNDSEEEDNNGDGEDDGDDEDGDDEEREEDVFGGFDSEGDGPASGSADEDHDEGGGEGNGGDREDEDSEDDQSPVKRLRPRRSHQAPSLAKSTPVVGGKVLRQRSSQRQSRSTSKSQSQSQSQSRGKLTRQSSASRFTAESSSSKDKTERKLTRSNSSSNASTSTRKISNPNPNPNAKETRSSAAAANPSSIETRGTKRSASFQRSKGSSSKRGRSPPSQRAEAGSGRAGSTAGGDGERGEGGGEPGDGGGSHRKRQKPLRYRNEE
ncbi:hypothetical protein QBC32DRAFT_326901 [Pseudoneurospora amorphoporcata]|uniref:Uncharacterized protein n=1 Tax=Pseudoneurospora amorphoporcata TaxID=241081 RepID=A0AAN6NR78_9PEZI|nr:hypothetical protein QBC32DRAFT_326901 [Pseudoneurospora amorphoporcata]